MKANGSHWIGHIVLFLCRALLCSALLCCVFLSVCLLRFLAAIPLVSVNLDKRSTSLNDRLFHRLQS